METQTWCLERYARLSSQGTVGVSADGWEHFDNKIEPLEMIITSTNFCLIHLGKRQVESLNLDCGHSSIKGVSKGDSLLIVYKVKDKSRRFRVKFSPTHDVTGESQCCACVKRLSKHIQIKTPDVSTLDTGSQQVSGTPASTPGKGTTLVGDVTLGQLATAIGSQAATLPELYARLDDGTEYDLGTLIKLCLTDPTFPAFVGKVEKELGKIKQESG